MFSTQNQNLEIYNSCRMTQNLDNIVKVFSSTINDFLFINWVLFSFGMMNIGLSFSINSDNIDGKYVSISFLYLGLILCLPSLGALVLTMLAIKGMKAWKKMLLIPLMIFLKIVPILMTSMTLISLVLKCKSLAGLLNVKNTPLMMMQVGMECLLSFLYLVTFFGWMGYFWFVTAIIMNRLEILFFHLQNPHRVLYVQEVPNRQMEVLVDDFPPNYNDLLDKEVNEEEDDASLPCYEVAREKEAEEGNIA